MLCIFSLLELFSEVSVENKNLLLLTVTPVWQVGAPAGAEWQRSMSVGTAGREKTADLGTWPPKRARMSPDGLLGTSV